MPIELSMPPAVSLTRGVGLPALSLGETLLMTSAPSRLKSSASAYSMAKQPEAGITGLRSETSPTLTLRSAKFHLPDHVADREDRAFAAHPQELLVAVVVEQAHARQAHAHAA